MEFIPKKRDKNIINMAGIMEISLQTEILY